VPEETAAHVWELMASFAGYGFPKAHAASYAVVAWRAAWCKAHFPAEFLAAVMANWGGYYRQSVYMSEARRLGLILRPPHINHSQSEFTTAYPHGEPILYMGLDQVRGLTHRTQKRIIQKRPFHTLADFILRADPRLQEAESLIRVGALEGLGPIPGLLQALNEGIWRSSQPSLFSASISGGQEHDWSLEEKLEAQTAILGIGVEAHPLEIYQDQIAALERYQPSRLFSALVIRFVWLESAKACAAVVPARARSWLFYPSKTRKARWTLSFFQESTSSTAVPSPAVFPSY
jgi:DNA polymerase III alpha subunit